MGCGSNADLTDNSKIYNCGISAIGAAGARKILRKNFVKVHRADDQCGITVVKDRYRALLLVILRENA